MITLKYSIHLLTFISLLVIKKGIVKTVLILSNETLFFSFYLSPHCVPGGNRSSLNSREIRLKGQDKRTGLLIIIISTS